MTDPTEVGRRLADAREEAGLTQAQAARLLGIDTQTLSRWERTGRVKPRDIVAATQLYRVPLGAIDESANRVGENTPDLPTSATRSPHPRDLSGSLDRLARDFEREIVRLGATNEEADYVHYALHHSAEARRFYMGDDSKPLSPVEQEEELRYQIEGLRVWVTRRIDKRAAEDRRKK